jgi:predicted transcriptional regulator
MMGITSSAVTQYLSGKRAGDQVRRIKSSENLMHIISNTTDIIAQDRKDGKSELSSARVIEAAQQISSLLRGVAETKPSLGLEEEEERGESRQVERGKILSYLSIIRKRIEAEQTVALRNMSLASRGRDELAKSLFRQIASDSMRHADILTSVASYIQKEEGLSTSTATAIPSVKQLEEILKEEEGAVDPEIEKLKKIDDPVIRLFLESIEMDEQKHYKLLSKLLEIGKSRAVSEKE